MFLVVLPFSPSLLIDLEIVKYVSAVCFVYLDILLCCV